LTGTNTGDQTTITGNAGTATTLATGRTIAITGDVTYTSPAFDGSGNVTAAGTVTRVNGTALSGLATGLLKNTTGTGVPSIALNSDLPVMTATVGGAVPTPPNNTTTFLRGDGTFAAPAAGGDMVLASIQSVSGTKTFDKDKLLVKGTSTGVTNLTTANASVTSYTATFPAKDGTVAMTSDISSIYTADGTLAGARTVTQNNNNLTFATGTARTIVDGSFQTLGAVYAGVRTYTGAANVDWDSGLNKDYLVVITNAAITNVLALPDPALNANRVLIIFNNTGGTVNFCPACSGRPIGITNITGTRPGGFISDGTSWFAISR
jgi:hypothetical protein